MRSDHLRIVKSYTLNMNVYGGGLGAEIQGGGALSLFGFNWWVQGLDCSAFQWQPPNDQQVRFFSASHCIA